MTDDTLRECVTWLNKQDFAFALTEMEDEARHLHAQIWLEVGRDRGEICRSLQRICERTIPAWDEAQKKVLRQGVRISYSDWYLDYLAENEEKGTPSEPIINNPPNCSLEYYPSQKEQEAVQAASSAVDKEMHNLAARFIEDHGEELPTQQLVATWLYQQCFHAKSISIPRQQRDRVEKMRILHAYLAGNRMTDIRMFMPKLPLKVDALEDKLLSERISSRNASEETTS